jgi:hypothetical protein
MSGGVCAVDAFLRGSSRTDQGDGRSDLSTGVYVLYVLHHEQRLTGTEHGSIFEQINRVLATAGPVKINVPGSSGLTLWNPASAEKLLRLDRGIRLVDEKTWMPCDDSGNPIHAVS